MTAELFINAKELIELTGYRRRKSQRQELTRRGYLFDVRADGSPLVLRAAVVDRLGGNQASRQPSVDEAAIRAILDGQEAPGR